MMDYEDDDDDDEVTTPLYSLPGVSVLKRYNHSIHCLCLEPCSQLDPLVILASAFHLPQRWDLRLVCYRKL